MLGAEFKFSKCFCISRVRMFHSTAITQGGLLGASFCTCFTVLKVTLWINWGCLLNWRHLSIVTIVLLLVGWKKDVENAWKCSYFCTEVDMPSVAHHLVKAFDEANIRRKSNEAHHDSCDFYWSQLLLTAWLNDWLFCLLNRLGIFLPRKAVSKTGNVQERDVIRQALSMANDSDVMWWPWLSPRYRCRPCISREISSFK